MATARSRKPVPAVEPTNDVAPLVADAAPAAPVAPVVVHVEPSAVATAVATAAAEAAAAEPAAELPTRFVVARHEGLGVHAVLTRASLRRWGGWEAVADLPDSEPAVLPAKYANPAV